MDNKQLMKRPNKLAFRITPKEKIAVEMFILFAALLCFELFNFSSSEYTLKAIFGDEEILGMGRASLLAIALCASDFAGIARVFTPETGKKEHLEVWVIFGAWFVVAVLNAGLVWYSVGTAMLEHEMTGSRLIDTDTLYTLVPTVVAVIVLLIRVSLILTFTAAVDGRTGAPRPTQASHAPPRQP